MEEAPDNLLPWHSLSHRSPVEDSSNYFTASGGKMLHSGMGDQNSERKYCSEEDWKPPEMIRL